jgi:hypothetical protein
VASWQKLPLPIRALDHDVGLAFVPLAPHPRDQLAEQRVVLRRDPHALDLAGMQGLSLMAGC